MAREKYIYFEYSQFKFMATGADGTLGEIGQHDRSQAKMENYTEKLPTNYLNFSEWREPLKYVSVPHNHYCLR